MKSLDFERASKSNSFHLRPARIVSSFFFRFEPATENSTKGRHSSFMVREDLHRQKIDKCEFLVYVVDKKKKERKKGKETITRYKNIILENRFILEVFREMECEE